MNRRTIHTGWSASTRRWGHLPTRRERRVWVLAMYSGLVAGDALLFPFKIAFNPLAGTSSLWVTFGALIALMPVLIWNRLACWSVPVGLVPPAWPGITLDERQQFVRDRSYRRAYQIVFLLFLVAGVAAYSLQEDLPGYFQRLSDLNLLPVVLVEIVLLLASLPVVCLAWTEPDESQCKPGKEIRIEETSEASC